MGRNINVYVKFARDHLPGQPLKVRTTHCLTSCDWPLNHGLNFQKTQTGPLQLQLFQCFGDVPLGELGRSHAYERGAVQYLEATHLRKERQPGEAPMDNTVNKCLRPQWVSQYHRKGNSCRLSIWVAPFAPAHGLTVWAGGSWLQGSHADQSLTPAWGWGGGLTVYTSKQKIITQHMRWMERNQGNAFHPST